MGELQITIPVGTLCEFDYKVTPDDTASVYGSGSLLVLATPRVVGLVEQAALRAVQPCLPEGYTTVGVRIELEHLQASAVDSMAHVRAEVLSTDGRRIEFRVEATDGERVLARGEHTRFVVHGERFMAKVQGSEAK